MSENLKAKLAEYVRIFNENDEEHFPTAIPNSGAYDFLARQIPLIDIPDKELERTYYFRWWTFRKHIRPTPERTVITEFLPDVRWAGAFNTINCAASFHIREGRWLRDPDGILPQYMDHWLRGSGNALSYSSWIPAAAGEYCALHGDEYGVSRMADLERHFAARLEAARTESGLYFSNDNRDGMEFSISGPGLRPTMNSYLIGDARALAHFARQAGDAAKAAHYDSFADELTEKMLRLLWRGDFFCTIPEKFMHEPLSERPDIPAEHDVRELVGYVPWYFSIPPREMDSAFDQLLMPDGFAAPAGLTTAEQRHPRFMEEHPHECLWNGPVWPYATTQVLVAAANMLRRPHGSTLTKADYYAMLRTYALSHRRTAKDGRVLDWIDENMHPQTGRWLARDILEDWGWLARKGGYERGKDYNHSMFCDLILSGLLGITPDENGALIVSPLIPDSWESFRAENIPFRGKLYTVSYTKTAGVSVTAQ